MRELRRPGVTAEDENATEMIRAWIANERVQSGAEDDGGVGVVIAGALDWRAHFAAVDRPLRRAMRKQMRLRRA